MERALTLMLSMLGIGSMGCTPSTEEEVAMYAAPYVEYHPLPRADVESDDITTNNEEELLRQG